MATGWRPCAVVWPPPLAAELARLARRDPRLVARIREAVARYAQTGYGDVKRLQGLPQYRLRVGTWRVVFDLDQAARRVIVIAFEPRRDVYRRR